MHFMVTKPDMFSNVLFCLFILCVTFSLKLYISQVQSDAKSQRHTWRFYTPMAANLSENRKRFSPPIGADTPGDFFRRSRRCGSFENTCDRIAKPDGLALMAIRSNKRRRSREQAHLANTRMPANLIADI